MNIRTTNGGPYYKKDKYVPNDPVASFIRSVILENIDVFAGKSEARMAWRKVLTTQAQAVGVEVEEWQPSYIIMYKMVDAGADMNHLLSAFTLLFPYLKVPKG